MKWTRWIKLLFLVLLVGCTQAPAVPSTSSPRANPTQPSGPLVPGAEAAAKAYLDAWKADDYPAMYARLTSVSRDALSEEEFTKHYRGVAAEAALSGLDYQVLSGLTNPDTAQISYRVTLHSSLVGDIQRDTLMNLSLERGEWRVQWDDTLVLPELKGGNYLSMQIRKSSRANIYDRNGHALVAQAADATAISLFPDQILPEQADTLFSELTELTGLRADTIQAMYANFPEDKGWYLPLGEVSADKIASQYSVLSTLSGLVLTPYKARYYFDGGIAPHVIGYVSVIQEGEVEEYRRKGYEQDERVGRSGLEKWGEPYLSGQRGGALYVYSAQGQPVTLLAEANARPSESIQTTLDREFQLGVQQSLGDFRAAAVVLERDTGRVLAMASSPAFDPNAFEPANYNSTTLLASLYENPDQPWIDRAAQGQYPLGSIFKIITMAAGLESGFYAPDTTYQCGYFFDELPGVSLNDWTYDYFQQDGRTIPSGLLTLQGGLIRSCNPWFWHIGLDLYNRGLVKAVSDMARGFGLGSKTGIEGVDEDAGQVPDPASPIDATNLSIGQGDLLVTPLQVADFVAAVGNGGTLYRPQVIEKVTPPGGDPTYVFQPQVRGKLPVSPQNLKAIQEAMLGVVSSTEPRGTAYHIFTGLDITVAGKTGTATSGSGQPHAWFAGYTDAGRADKPDIAIAVVMENAGEGSVMAAPVFRRIVELYFRGNPGKLYPWESTYYVTRTPDPSGGDAGLTGTPVPTP